MKYKYNAVILSICLLLMLFGFIKDEEPVPYAEQEKTTTKFQTRIENISKAETIVYRTDYGAKYHQVCCRYLRKSKTEIRMSVAEETGFEPCSVCKP